MSRSLAPKPVATGLSATLTIEMSRRTTTHPRQTMNAVKFALLRLAAPVSRTFSQRSDILNPAVALPDQAQFRYHYLVINTKAERVMVSTPRVGRVGG